MDVFIVLKNELIFSLNDVEKTKNERSFSKFFLNLFPRRSGGHKHENIFR